MAFPLKAVNGARAIKEPQGISILEPFLKGELDYIPNNRATAKQSIRGLRPLLELPFIQLTEKGQEVLIQELQNLPIKLDADTDQYKYKDAKEQIIKAKRNVISIL